MLAMYSVKVAVQPAVPSLEKELLFLQWHQASSHKITMRVISKTWPDVNEVDDILALQRYGGRSRRSAYLESDPSV